MTDPTPGEDFTSPQTGKVWRWRNNTQEWRNADEMIYPTKDGIGYEFWTEKNGYESFSIHPTFAAAEAAALGLDREPETVATAPAKPACERCAWWDGEAGGGEGQCLRRAPIAASAADGYGAVWPITDAGSWCGEFKESAA